MTCKRALLLRRVHNPLHEIATLRSNMPNSTVLGLQATFYLCTRVRQTRCRYFAFLILLAWEISTLFFLLLIPSLAAALIVLFAAYCLRHYTLCLLLFFFFLLSFHFLPSEASMYHQWLLVCKNMRRVSGRPGKWHFMRCCRRFLWSRLQLALFCRWKEAELPLHP